MESICSEFPVHLFTRLQYSLSPVAEIRFVRVPCARFDFRADLADSRLARGVRSRHAWIKLFAGVLPSGTVKCL